MEYVLIFKDIYSSSWKLFPLKEELSRNNVLKGVAEAGKASQPRTGTGGWGVEKADWRGRAEVLVQCVLMKELIMRVMHMKTQLLSEVGGSFPDTSPSI